MIILVVFAFLAGVVTILSPCILPILPIVLSGSVTGGKKRPLGIITGFIASFTFFTLFLSAIVKATGISADLIRTVSVVIIAVFGASLLVPKIQVWMEQLFSGLANVASASQTNAKGKTRSDFIAGIFVGMSLGLLWTPCVGPILASIITLAATSTVTAGAVIITLAYSFGTAIPMFIITWGGRSLLNNHPWLLAHTGRIQKIFGVVMIVTAIAIYFSIDRKFQSYILDRFPQYGVGLTQFEDNDAVNNQLEKLQNEPMDESKRGKPMSDFLASDLGKAPDFVQGGEWINSDALTMEGLRGKVVLVDFWTYTCINCIRTIPYLKDWHSKYNDKGLVIVGVHTPEFEFEKNIENVKKSVEDFGLEYPIMQDNNYATWRAYANRYWPAKYLVDKNGRIRYTHFGEGAYDETERVIQTLIAETGTDVTEEINNPTYRITARTPELYLGYQRMSFLANDENLIPDRSVDFRPPSSLPLHYFSFEDTWIVGTERSMPVANAKLRLHFDASEVFLVMRPAGIEPGRVRVFLDGNIVTEGTAGEDVVNGIVTIDTDRLYKLIQIPNPGEHLLLLEFLDGNTELYAFTFG